MTGSNAPDLFKSGSRVNDDIEIFGNDQQQFLEDLLASMEQIIGHASTIKSSLRKMIKKKTGKSPTTSSSGSRRMSPTHSPTKGSPTRKNQRRFDDGAAQAAEIPAVEPVIKQGQETEAQAVVPAVEPGQVTGDAQPVDPLEIAGQETDAQSVDPAIVSGQETDAQSVESPDIADTYPIGERYREPEEMTPPSEQATPVSVTDDSQTPINGLPALPATGSDNQQVPS